MRIIELWKDDENTEFWFEDGKGNRTEITSYSYDEIGSSGFDVLQHAMKNLAFILDFQYEFEEEPIEYDDGWGSEFPEDDE